ncbi:MAG: PIG-L deacetylase family protein [Janthinobacterium lividum]
MSVHETCLACITLSAVIISLTDDLSWQTKLATLPAWEPPAMPTLIIAPHPDDETLGAGALIATLRSQGIPVTVVAATDGENCYDISADERQEMRGTREKEQLAALAMLGVPAEHVHRLRLNDSGLHLQEDDLTAAIQKIASTGMHLIAPWSGDFHPDHEACAHSAARVADALGLPLTSYFFWTWHRGEASVLDQLPVRRFVAGGEALRLKEEALQCHASQLHWPDDQPILPERLLGPARWPFEVFLPA